jgi:hypothetical protein
MIKSILSSLITLILPVLSIAQVFIASGTVTDKQSGQPLAGASVVCQHTTIGTTTNAEGRFTLRLPQGGYELAVSFSGYETFSMRINSQTEAIEQLAIGMKQKERSMDEVAITVSNEVKDGWEKYGAFFREQFIGLTPNSAQCTIENPETLKFFYNKKKNRLKVTAKDELRIRNQALGYTVRYQLDSFVHEYASGATQFTGFPFFEALEGTADEQAVWTINREKAYYGSMLHFTRCYYDSTLGENGYRLERLDPRTDKPFMLKNPYDSVFYARDSSGELEIRIPGKMRVVYTLEKPDAEYLSRNKLSAATTIQISIVDFPESFSIEENGYFYDQRDIIAIGYWSWEKVGDFLPYNYEPPDN